MSVVPKVPEPKFVIGDRVSPCYGLWRGMPGTIKETRKQWPKAHYTVSLDKLGDVNLSELELGSFKEYHRGTTIQGLSDGDRGSGEGECVCGDGHAGSQSDDRAEQEATAGGPI